jgi:hypothetical protein
MTTFSVHVLTIWGSANDAASNITETKTHIPAGVRVTFACFVTPSHNVALCGSSIPCRAFGTAVY